MSFLLAPARRQGFVLVAVGAALSGGATVTAIAAPQFAGALAAVGILGLVLLIMGITQ